MLLKILKARLLSKELQRLPWGEAVVASVGVLGGRGGVVRRA
jgi:hypothetical protein